MPTDTAAVAWMAGPFLVACALLGWSGANKIVHPAATRAAARAAGVPSSTGAVRAFGAIEVTLAIAGAVFGGVAALLIAVMFVLLAVIAWRLHRRAPDTPCGCLGARSDAPASRAHVVVDAAAAVVALIAAFGGSPLATVAEQPLAAVPFIVLVGCATRLALLAMELGPGSAGAKEAL